MAVLWWSNVCALLQLKLDQDSSVSDSLQTWLLWRNRKGLLASERACSRIRMLKNLHSILLATTIVHSKSQSTTTSRVTPICKRSEWYSLHDSLLLPPLEIQHPLNPGKAEGWTSRWNNMKNNIPIWTQSQLFKCKVYIYIMKAGFPQTPGLWWNSQLILPAVMVHSFQTFVPMAKVSYWNLTSIAATVPMVSH